MTRVEASSPPEPLSRPRTGGPGENLRVRVLGPLEVLAAERPVALGGPRERAVLALLVVHAGEVVEAERLLDEVWGDSPPATGKGTVQVSISRLRSRLASEGAALRTVAPGYVLEVTPEHVDAGRFQLLVEQGRALIEAAPERASAVLGEALSLWRGSAYADLVNWSSLAQEARRLDDLRLDAFALRVTAELALGNHAELLGALRETVRQHPLHEPLTGRLMLALYRNGQEAEALAAYDHCCRALDQEYGAIPSAELRNLHLRILQQDPGLDQRRPGLASVTGPPASKLSNLPPRSRVFSGRDDLFDVLNALFAAGPAVALYGLGGIGKTQLAVEYAHRHLRDGLELAWWIPARGTVTATRTLATLASRLGLDDRREGEGMVAALWAALGRRGGWLLVYDDAPDPEELEPLLPPAGSGRVLITSTNPAWGRLAAPLAVPVFSREESVTFLLSRSGLGGRESAAELAHLLGDLPLGLEQASAFVEEKGMRLEEYVPLFRQNDELLSLGRPANYDRTLGTTWHLAFQEVRSHRLADELLSTCAFLAPDAIRLDLLLRWCREQGHDELDLYDAVGELWRYSLVERDQRTLRMHRLVQAAMQAFLTPAQRAHRLQAVAGLLARAAPAEPEHPSSWDLWEALVPDVLAVAAATAREGAAVPDLHRLLRHAARYLESRAAYRDARRVVEMALRLVEVAADGDRLQVAELQADLGRILDKAGDLAGALAAHELALARFEAQLEPTDPRVARILTRFGHVQNCGGNAQAAIAAHERALTILRAHSDANPYELACVLTDLGYARWAASNLDAAATAFEQALALFHESVGEQHPQAAKARSGLGMVKQDAGDLRGALDCQLAALATLEAVHHRQHPDVAETLDKLGYLRRLLGDVQAAVRHHTAAAEILEAVFGPADPRLGMTLTNLGVALLQAGHAAAARDAQRRAHAIFSGAAAYGPRHPHTQLTARRLAVSLLPFGETAEARQLAEDALAALAAALGADHPDVGRTLSDLGLVLAADGDTAAAKACLRRALRILRAAYGPDNVEVRAVARQLAG